MEPGPDKYPRNQNGHLTREARDRALADVLACVQAGVSSINGVSVRLGLARPTVRDLLGKLGLVATAGSSKGPGKITVRKGGPVESKQVRKTRLKREAAAKKAIEKEAARLRKEAGATPKPPVLERPEKQPDPPAYPADGEILPVLDEPKPRPKGRPKGLLADTLPGNPGPLDERVDKIALVQVPAGFDEIERLRKISISPWIDAGQQIAALRILVGVRSNKGKIDWSTVTPEQIPEEMRHRLAGMLLGWVDLAELPEQVRAAPLVCRQVYKLTGILPGTVAAAEVVLERWLVLRAELRELAGEARVELGAKAPPLELSLAAETAYVAPQWDVN